MRKLTQKEAEAYMTIPQVAEVIAVKERAIYRMIEQGRAKAEKFEIEGERPKMLMEKAEVERLTPKAKYTEKTLAQAKVDTGLKLSKIANVNNTTIAQATQAMIEFWQRVEISTITREQEIIIAKIKTELEILQEITIKNKEELKDANNEIYLL